MRSETLPPNNNAFDVEDEDLDRVFGDFPHEIKITACLSKQGSRKVIRLDMHAQRTTVLRPLELLQL
jgi:hypothetical protein